MKLVCTKPKRVEERVEAWIKINHEISEFWRSVLIEGTYEELDKTREEVEALANYFEGMYDMSIQFRGILKEE
jgi:nitroimidazol reductase NimA-like FMN-containing flavoprotein (pyridoxamine 5'-phosphate oxidase superfamily)